MPRKRVAQVLVAGDVCLDLVAVPIPAPARAGRSSAENWRLTGEKRTHYLRGGAMLLAQMIEQTTAGTAKVVSPSLPTPRTLRGCVSSRILPDELFERLTRNEVVHSLLEADRFPVEDGQKDSDAKVLRLRHVHGYSGPAEAAVPSLTPRLPKRSSVSALLVLDDTGNRFRVAASQWPDEVEAPGNPPPLVLLKLHRPLPLGSGAGAEPSDQDLWAILTSKHADRLVVVLNMDDLREAGASISTRLSWERTALDFAAQIQGNELFQRLRGCRWLIVRCGLEGALCWHCPGGDAAQARLWLVYDPAGIEGSYAAGFRGFMTGYGSAFTAGLAAKLAGAALPKTQEEIPQPLRNGIMAGLASARALLEAGFVPSQNNSISYPVVSVGIAARKGNQACSVIAVPLPGSPANPDGDRWTILKKRLPGGELLDDTARELVLTGQPTDALKSVPLGRFGNISTYDRREIEAYRALSNLIREYLENPKPDRPLCVAVFGPPGAGKSFGVREVAQSVARGRSVISERAFNLSQFQAPEDLGPALHLVRDDVIAGKVPLVFFDEFDSSVGTAKLFWLKFLLAPMQDGKFLEHGAEHPIGKAIFVFAGGTCDSFDLFARKAGTSEADRAPTELQFREAKGPDFISRLRGILDVTGIEHSDDYRGPALLRRAAVLRFLLPRKARQLLDTTKRLRMAPGLVRAFLHVARFEHGVRSLESLLDMSQLAGHEDFNPGCLPSPSQLRLHVTPTQTDEPGLGFLDLVQRESPFSRDDREKIAEAIHEHYLEERKKPDGGYNPEKASHQSWQQLSEFYKDSNRRQADDTPRKLRLMSLDWGRPDPEGKRRVIEAFESDEKLEERLETAARKEHDRWLAERRLAGWTHGEKEDPQRRQSPAMREWEAARPEERLPDKEKEKDRASIRRIPRYLKAAGYAVFAPASPERKAPAP